MLSERSRAAWLEAEPLHRSLWHLLARSSPLPARSPAWALPCVQHGADVGCVQRQGSGGGAAAPGAPGAYWLLTSVRT